MSALASILFQAADENVLSVEHYLKAAGEVLALTFGVTGILTAVFHPHFFESNPLKDRLGYNNLCVMFDLPPANYVGACSIAFTVYLVCMYVRLDLRRLRLEKDAISPFFLRVATIFHYAYAVSMCVFILVFLVPPTSSPWGHTCIFIQFIFFRWSIIATNFYEGYIMRRPIRNASVLFISIYTIVSLFLPVLYLVNFAIYDVQERSGEDPFIPWWITCTVDYLWFCCLAITTKMLPDSPRLRETHSLTNRTFELPNGKLISTSSWRSAANASVKKAGELEENTKSRQGHISCPVLAALYRHKAIVPDDKGVVGWLELAEAVSSYTGCRGDVLEKIFKATFADTSDEFKAAGCRIFELHGNVHHGYSTGCRSTPNQIDSKLFDEIMQKYAVPVVGVSEESHSSDEYKQSQETKKIIYLANIHDIATYTRRNEDQPKCCTAVVEKKATMSFAALFEAFQRVDRTTGRPYLSVRDLHDLLIEGKFPRDFIPHEWGLRDILDELSVVACGCPGCFGECLGEATRLQSEADETQRLMARDGNVSLHKPIEIDIKQ